MTKIRNRTPGIDIARAIAMLLVVFEHVLRCYNDTFIPIVSEQMMHTIIHAISFFHMPVFFLIAGFYMARNYKGESTLSDYSRFQWTKFQRLMIPYFVVCTLQLAAGIAGGIRNAGDIPNEIYKSIVTPVNGPAGHGWFLVALMSFFIIWPILEYIFRKNCILIFLTLSILDIYKNDIGEHLNLDIFQAKVLITYLPVFAIGVMIGKKIPQKLLSSGSAQLSVTWPIALLLAYLCIALKTTTLLEDSDLRPLIYSLASQTGRIFGAVAIIKLSMILPKISARFAGYIAHIGRYSYGIYLYHIIAIMILITVISKLDISDNAAKISSIAVFIIATAMAYTACRIAQLNKTIARLCLGENIKT
ncbi:MAG: acyltransferase family protein [Sedimentisphaeraceae bacterium JB056]